MIETLILFGATGDLAGRCLLPALARLGHARRLRWPDVIVDGAEAEAAWRVVDPVLKDWERDLVPLQDCSAGSAGPSSRAT